MRRASILGKKHKGGWVILCDPDLPLAEQRSKFQSLLGVKSNESLSEVIYHEDLMPDRSVKFLTPEDYRAKQEKQQAELDRIAEDQKKEEQARNDRENGVVAKQQAEHQETIDTHNAQVAAQKTVEGKPTVAATQAQAALEASKNARQNRGAQKSSPVPAAATTAAAPKPPGLAATGGEPVPANQP